MLKFYRFLILPLTAVFLASTAGIARYAADSCTQARMYRQLAAQTENFPGDAASPGNDFLPQYQALYTQNSDLAGWIQIDGTNINYPVMQSKHDPDFYLKHNFEKADSPHGCPYVQANCDLQTPSDNILVYGHNMKDGTMFSDLLQYKRESFWEQHRIIRFDTLTAQAEYTVMAVFRGEAENLFAYYQFLRIHKSYLINGDHILQMSNYKVLLDTGMTLKGSRKYFSKAKLEFYRGR